MQQFSGRERLGVAAAGAIVLGLGVGGWAFSHASVPATAKPSLAAGALRPLAANGSPAALELAAGGSTTANTFAANAATTVATTLPAATGGAPIFVHVAGAVKTPGVYKFQNGDRINDAVKAAGGFQSSADRDALNLADTLQDADQIYIPTADSVSAGSGGSNAARSASGSLANPPASSVRKDRSRRKRPLITPGTAPTSQGRDRQIMPLPGPLEPGDVAIQPLPTLPRDGAEKYPTLAATVITPRRGRVIGRPAPVTLPADVPAPTDDSADVTDATDSDVPAAVAPSRASAYAGIKGGVSKKASAAKGGSGKSGKFKNPGDGVVHLNSATAEQLEKIPGVGPAMSARIIEYRKEIGKFTDPSQMMEDSCT